MAKNSILTDEIASGLCLLAKRILRQTIYVDYDDV
jgi:hypothetical protein